MGKNAESVQQEIKETKNNDKIADRVTKVHKS